MAEKDRSITDESIGRNIRAIRESKKMTLTDTAEKADLTKSGLSKIEKGQSSPPIATLIRIADILEVPVTRFFTLNYDNPPYVFTPHGEGQNVSMQGSKFGYSYEALCLGKGDKKAEPFLLTIRPDDPEGFFYHSGQEFIYMLSGKIAFTIDDDELVMQPGDSLYFDSGHEHRTRVIGSEEAKFICIFM